MASRTSQIEVEIRKIKDVTDIIFSGGTPSTKIKEYWNGGIPWLSSGETRNDFIFETEKTITKQGIENSSARLAKQYDVIVASAGQGNTRGQVSLCLIDTFINQSIIALRAKNTVMEPRFLYYNLKSRYPELRRISDSFSSRGSLTTKLLAELEISVPPLEQQRKNSETVYTLDMKILTIRKENQTLEKIIQLIFKSWFIEFKGQTEFVNSESHKIPKGSKDSQFGKIPAGWKIGCLGDIAENRTHLISPEKVVPDTPYIGLEHMPRKSIALSQWGYASDAISNKFMFKEGEMLFGKLRPYFHKVGFAVTNGVCSTDVLVIVPKESFWYGLTLCHISSTDFVNYADAASTGTRMPRANWKDMSEYVIVIPPYIVVNNFTKLVKPLLDKIKLNILESHILSSLKKSLLAKHLFE